MKITAIQLENVRGFQDMPKTSLSKTINVFIGPNNAGKSTLLNSFFLLQRRTLNNRDITVGKSSGKIDLYFSGTPPMNPNYNSIYDRISFRLDNPQGFLIRSSGTGQAGFNQIAEEEPKNLIYPFLSKRKTIDYTDIINEKNANSVSGNFENLYSKIDRLMTPQFRPGNSQYIKACNNILGFEISTLALGAGKKAVYFVHNLEHIPLTAMGEGVANMLGLITDLCIAEEKIFLIEEPENDIHPKALKALLNLIIEKSKSNQFFISTHSNIVMKYLGSSDGSKVFNVTSELKDPIRQNLFVSEIREISPDPEERRQVLEDLGYDFFDFDLWKGWLFLEESSAEVIIRDYLVNWFVEPLKNKIRTFSSGGTSNMLTKFEDFDRLFVFLHLEPTYKNKVWILIDAGKEEEEIIKRMKEKYIKAGWNESNFSQLNEHNFEKYYPAEFQDKVTEIEAIQNKQRKREAKKALLEEVKAWITDDEDHAKEQFKESAKEVIEYLKRINKEINQ